jgi:hypothetical protein
MVIPARTYFVPRPYGIDQGDDSGEWKAKHKDDAEYQVNVCNFLKVHN